MREAGVRGITDPTYLVGLGNGLLGCGMRGSAIDIRDVAIIAHVDHGKTTLVDKLILQTGLLRENQVFQE